MLLDPAPPPTSRPGRRTPALDVRVDEDSPGLPHRITLSGELDLSTVPILDAALGSVVTRGHLRVSLDVRELTFCDVSGLNRLLAAQAELRHAGGELTVHGPCPSLQIMLDILSPRVALELAPPPR